MELGSDNKLRVSSGRVVLCICLRASLSVSTQDTCTPSLYFFGHFIFECRRQPCRSTAEEDKNNPPRREKWTLMTG